MLYTDVQEASPRRDNTAIANKHVLEMEAQYERAFAEFCAYAFIVLCLCLLLFLL